MTCRHKPGDPDCSASREGVARLTAEYEARLRERVIGQTPDAEKFEIIDSEDIQHILVLKVKYPSCDKCSYEGTKILVYENVRLKDAIKWRRIDPHFSDSKTRRTEREAPSPVARFPASARGWKDALAYARGLVEDEDADDQSELNR